MDGHITINKNLFTTFIDALLDDEHGVSEKTYMRLALMLREHSEELWCEFDAKVDATDGRFYYSLQEELAENSNQPSQDH